jgi:hypothetical protein
MCPVAAQWISIDRDMTVGGTVTGLARDANSATVESALRAVGSSTFPLPCVTWQLIHMTFQLPVADGGTMTGGLRNTMFRGIQRRSPMM